MAKFVIGKDKTVAVPAFIVHDGPEYYMGFSKGAYNKLQKNLTMIDLSGITDIGDYVLYSAYYKKPLTGVVDLSSLTDVSGSYALGNCFYQSSISGVDLSSLIDISGEYALYFAFGNNSNFTTVDFSSLTNISGNYALYYAFKDCRNLTSVDVSSITNISGAYALTSAFESTGLTSLNFASLTEISGSNALSSLCTQTPVTTLNFPVLRRITGSYAFNTICSSSSLTTVNLGALEEVTGEYAFSWAFQYDHHLTSADIHSLKVVSGRNGLGGMFGYCTALTSIDIGSLVSATVIQALGSFVRGSGLTTLDFKSLKNVQASQVFENMCNSCLSLTDIYFRALNTSSFGGFTNQFYGTLTSVTGCTVHFPANLQSTVESLQYYPNFGGTSTVVLFDLPSTYTLTDGDDTAYERNPKYDTQTALAWRVKDGGTTSNPIIDWTPFYTSGTTDPQVGDTIYSDDTCTTVVSTIASIA